jgi:hypothetical protein
MIKWNNINIFLSEHKKQTWKNKFKIGVFFILIGYIIFILKEVIIGLISLVFFIIGCYFFYQAFLLWYETY